MSDTTPPTVRATDEARAREVLADAIRAQGDSAQSADGIAAGKDHAVWAKVAIAAMLTFARDASTDAGVREALIAAQEYFASLSVMTADDGQAVFDKINAALATPAPLADAGRPIDAPDPEIAFKADIAHKVKARFDTPTPRPAEQPGERERIARIVDPRAFGNHAILRHIGSIDARPDNQRKALAKADAILAQPGAGGEVGRYRVALERIADPRNKHFAGDAQVVARAALDSRP